MLPIIYKTSYCILMRKATILTFYLALIWLVTFLFFHFPKKSHWELSIAAMPTSLRPLFRKLSRMGKYLPPTPTPTHPPTRHVRLDTQTLCGICKTYITCFYNGLVNPRPDEAETSPPPSSIFLPIAKKNERKYRHQSLHTPYFINVTQPDRRNFPRLW